jgi:hypothetical protein
MSTTAISTGSIFQELQSFYQTRQSDLKQLGRDLQSGNLAGAQRACTTLAALGQNGPFANSEPFAKSSRAQAFDAIGQALQAGDLAGAQAAFATLKSSNQNNSASQAQANPATIVDLTSTQPNTEKVAAEIIINFYSAPNPAIGAPSGNGQSLTTGTTSNTNGATGVPEIVINLEGAFSNSGSTTATSGSTSSGSTSGAYNGATGVPEIVINLGLGAPPNGGISGTSGGDVPPEIVINLEGAFGNSGSTAATSGSTSSGSTSGAYNGATGVPELVINLGGVPNLGAPPNSGISGTSGADVPPQLIINLKAQQNYELIVNLFSSSLPASQSGSNSGLSLQA